MKKDYDNRSGVGKKPTPKSAKKKTKATFIKNPLGRFRLGYRVGSSIFLEDISKELADLLVKEEYVITVQGK